MSNEPSAPPTVITESGWKDLLSKYGAWTVLVFYLLGAIPGVASPVDKITNGFKEAMAAHNADAVTSLALNRQVMRQLLYTMRALCERTQQTKTNQRCTAPDTNDQDTH